MEIYLRYCVILLVIVSVCSFSEDFDRKYCDSKISVTKVAELEQCDQNIPKEIKQSTEQCLKEVGKGTSYREYMKTYCDSKTRKQYLDCHFKNMEALQKSGVSFGTDEKMTEVFNNNEKCLRKALDVNT